MREFIPSICGGVGLYVPDTGCDDCTKLENRVSILEECCEEVKSDLLNFYTKNETYSKQEVDELINTMNTWNIVEVDELPQTGEPFTLYLVPSDPTHASNVKDEYIYINSGWEKIGTTDIDLSNYYNKSEVDNLLNSKQDKLTITKGYIGSASNWSAGTASTHSVSEGVFAVTDSELPNLTITNTQVVTNITEQ